MRTFLPYLPNCITALRIFLTYPVILYILSNQYQGALLVFTLAGISDGLDGAIARRYHCTTRLGALLDPLADKLLMFGTFTTLSYLSHIPKWLAIIVIGRDLLIIIGIIIYSLWLGPITYKPIFISKLNMALQVLFVFLLLLRLDTWSLPYRSIQIVALGMIATNLISLIEYGLFWAQSFLYHANTR